MKGVVLKNNYYTDEGMEYVYARLKSEFLLRGVALDVLPNPALPFEKNCGYDFVIYWDKDYAAALNMERNGLRLYNCAKAIEICDDKYLTYIMLQGIVDMPKTVAAPLMYDTVDTIDENFLEQLTRLKFPLIVKARKGSQGRQIYKVSDLDGLRQVYGKMKHTPHIYQEYVDASAGKDIRVYTVGGKFVGAVERENFQSYKSNSYCGGKTSAFVPDKTFIEKAEKISNALDLNYAAVDFFKLSEPVLVEVNSNAYFKGIEALGKVNLAGLYADYILGENHA